MAHSYGTPGAASLSLLIMTLTGRAELDAAEGGDVAPFVVIEGDPAVGLVLICDHAENRIPPEYDSLGLEPAELARERAAPGDGATRHANRQ